MPTLLTLIYIAVLVVIGKLSWNIGRNWREKRTAAKVSRVKYNPQKQQVPNRQVCPYCSYDKPKSRPWGLCRCNECQRHFVSVGYHPTSAEASLLAEEEKECRIAEEIIRSTNILNEVAAHFSKQNPGAQGMYKFQNGSVVAVVSGSAASSHSGTSEVAATYQPLKTLAGNMRLCILCMEYLRNLYSQNYELGEGFFSWN